MPPPCVFLWMCRSAGASPGRRRATRRVSSVWLRLKRRRSSWVPLGKVCIVLVPTGHPPSLRFGHPDVTSDDTAFPRWGTVRVRPRFPDAPSGCQPGRSPMRSEERAERPGDGCPCVGAEETCGVPSQPAGRGRTPPLQTLLSATSLPPGSVPDQYAKPSQPGTDQPTHQPVRQRPGPAE